MPDEPDWVAAPASSHLKRFGYLDARDSIHGGTSHLLITFRASKGRPETEYTFYFADAEDGDIIFELLKNDDQPGTVVDQFLRKRGVPYKRTR